ncbi:MAG: YerC/YecD family TrpR-related protein [bacterium]
MKDILKQKQYIELFEIIASLQDVNEVKNLFRDLCTMSELKAMAERWKVAKLVNDGVSYRKISELTGASTATVTRVAQWLHHGKGGYQLMLEKLK